MSHRVLKDKVTRDRSMIDEIGSWAAVAWQRFEQRYVSNNNDRDEWESRKKKLEPTAKAAARCDNKAMLMFGSEGSE